jgi:hypothetical protein
VRQQARCDAGQREDVDTEHLEQGLVAGQLGVDLDDGRGCGNVGVAQDLLEQGFVETAGRADQAQIGLAGQGAHAAAEFVEGGFVDGLHRHAERHAEDDGEQENRLAMRRRPREPRNTGARVIPAGRRASVAGCGRPSLPLRGNG